MTPADQAAEVDAQDAPGALRMGDDHLDWLALRHRGARRAVLGRRPPELLAPFAAVRRALHRRGARHG